jgi:Glycosyl hydrolases family 38 N-terminal domain.
MEATTDKLIKDIEELKEIHIIPYCHTDYAWTNIRSWHICRYINSYSEALDLIREKTGHTWVIDNVTHSLLPFLELCPDRFDELKDAIKKGDVNIANGGWSLARPAQVGEETYLRNLIASDRKFRELFGDEIVIDTLFNADTAIGHCQLPQIVRGMGYKYYYSNRPSTFMNKRGIPKQFRWYGLDGSDILVTRGEYGGFIFGKVLESDAHNDFDTMLAGYREYDLNEHLNLLPTGVVAQFEGCDDYLPLRNIYDNKIDLPRFMDEWNANFNSHIGFSTLSKFFNELEKEKNIPDYRGILDPYDLSYNHPRRGNNSYWYMRYAGDRALTELESVCAIAASNGADYPQEKIDEFWHGLFEITGHALEAILDVDNKRVYNAFLGNYYSAQELIYKKCDEIARLVGAGTRNEHVIINTLGHTVTEYVRLYITSEFGVNEFRLSDMSGADIPYQIVDVVGGDKPYEEFKYSSAEVMAKITVPPLSVQVIKVDYTGAKITAFGDAQKMYFNSAPPRLRLIATDNTIRTPRLAAVFKNGILTQLYDNLTGKKSVITAPLFNLGFTKTPHTNSWLFDFTPLEISAFIPEKSEIINNGPYYYRYRTTGKIAGSGAVIDYIINDTDGTVFIDLDIDNRETGGFYTADFGCEEGTPIRADIPFGSQELDTSEMYENSPAYDGFEVGCYGQFSAKSWFAYNREFKLAVMHKDCSSYSRYMADKNLVSVILTHVVDIDSKPELDQSCTWFAQEDKAAYACQGHQRFSLALTLDESTPADFTRKALSLRKPLRGVRCYKGTNNAPAKSVFDAQSADSIAITAFYREADAYIVRFYECNGECINFTANVSDKIKKAEKINLVGKKMCDIAVKNVKLELQVKAYEIVTLKLS